MFLGWSRLVIIESTEDVGVEEKSCFVKGEHDDLERLGSKKGNLCP